MRAAVLRLYGKVGNGKTKRRAGRGNGSICRGRTIQGLQRHNQIVEKLESTGMILALVTRTAYKGGVSIPVSTVKPTATWVNEGAGSDKQKKNIAKDGMITFAYHKLRCAVAVSLEVDTMAISAFETLLINNIVEARA